VPPDVFAAESADAEGGVQDEPEKIFNQEKENVKTDDAQLQTAGKDRRLERERGVDHGQHENQHPEVIAGQGARAVKETGPAVLDSPGGQLGGPAIGSLDLNFQPGENDCRQDQIGRKK